MDTMQADFDLDGMTHSALDRMATAANDPSHGLEFYETLAISSEFGDLSDTALYTALPGDWMVGVADIVASTQAVSAGHYKNVNTVAAAVIAVISNALPGRDFPFVFAGDGCGFALPPEHRAMAEEAMKAVRQWARSAFGLTLRIALVPVATIRAAGHDVTVARYSPSPDVAYAMFAGGGIAHAEDRMKAGDFGIDPADEATARPDLGGLYCRFAEIPARRGVILSLVVLPGPDTDPQRFAELTREVLAIAADEGGTGNPVPDEGPRQTWPSRGLMIEAKAEAAITGRPLLRAWMTALKCTFLAHMTFVLGVTVGDFDPKRYIDELVRNTDFRKFDDGLRMTLDCSPRLADRLEARLAAARTKGVARIGTHRQTASLMTCFVPSSSSSDHVHFVDGAMGGYAAAAAMAATAPRPHDVS